MQHSFNLASLRRLSSRSALLLTLGFGLGSCEKILDVKPQNSIDAGTGGLTTRQDVEAGLRGCYDALQSANYYGLRYQSFSDLISQNIRHTGTFPTFAQIYQNQILTDNVDVSNVWIAIYDGVNRANYLIDQAGKLSDPAYNSLNAIAEARTLRAFHYINLLNYWGGSTTGFGDAGGLGVPLRLTATTAVGEQTKPTARATEAAVVAAIRADLDYAVTNLANTSTSRVTKLTALALRARLELYQKQYADALTFAKQIPSTTGDTMWQLQFSNTDSNQLAFFWFPGSAGGRNEFDPSNELALAHPAGDTRLPINVVTATNATATYPVGTTRKYYRIATSDDPVNIVRYSEVILTIAEAAARTGDLVTATTQVNLIRVRAGLAPVAGLTQDRLITEVLLQRRLELAHEGHYWFDLRRTNTVQTAIPAYSQTFRNLWPIPQREILNSTVAGTPIIAQNPNY